MSKSISKPHTTAREQLMRLKQLYSMRVPCGGGFRIIRKKIRDDRRLAS